MPMIQTLNATNSSFILEYGRYTDFNVWVLLLILVIGLIITSRYLARKDDVGRLLLSVLSIVFSVAVVWGSLSLAYFDYAQGASLIDNQSTINQSITYTYIYPVQQILSSPALTGVAIAILIFSFLNALDIFLVMMQTPSVDDMKKKGGRGVR
jgi:phosphoglycerol transferase MdoB-like AlkP superfamily enzyme